MYSFNSTEELRREKPRLVLAEEFVYQEDKIPVIVVAPYGPSFDDMIARLSQESKIQVVECKSSFEAASIAHGIKWALLLLHGDEIKTVVPHITLLKLLKDEVQGGRVRPVMTTYIDEVAVLSKLAFYGCTEVIPEPISGKGLVFKLQRHLKSLEQMITESRSQAAAKEIEAKKKPKRKQVLNGPEFRYTNPLELTSDFWVFQPVPPRKIGRRWVIPMSGPHPDSGVWSLREADKAWVWKPTDLEFKSRMEPDSSWVFIGEKPDIKNNTWLFIGIEPYLAYYVGKLEKGVKICVDNFGILVLAKDADGALDSVPVIDTTSIKLKRLAGGAPRLAALPGHHSHSPKSKIESTAKDETAIVQSKPQSRDIRDLREKLETLKKELVEIKLDSRSFGVPPGKWDFVCNQPGGVKWYVYVPSQVLEHIEGAPSIEALPEYWMYVGPKEPVLLDSPKNSEWVFYVKEPTRVPEFKKLQKIVQDHLKNRFALNKNVTFKKESTPTSLTIDTTKHKITPFLLSLMISDQVWKTDQDPKEWLQKFCYYVSENFDGIRTELWTYSGEKWSFVTSCDGTPGELKKSLNKVDSFPWTEAQALVVPVVQQLESDDEVIGALLFGGPDAENISIDSAQTFSVIAKGLVQGYLDFSKLPVSLQKKAA